MLNKNKNIAQYIHTTYYYECIYYVIDYKTLKHKNILGFHSLYEV